ncbi:MAG TPA: zinc ribbon domain-containing protein [Vicinamibacteria bacterium]|nr:zinc ribbon domain-containing protein [Vicinamibacteria bacterium]
MPIYEYLCHACAARFEKYVRAFGERVPCPTCGAWDVEKLLSSFATTASSAGEAPARGGCCGGGCGCRH